MAEDAADVRQQLADANELATEGLIEDDELFAGKPPLDVSNGLPGLSTGLVKSLAEAELNVLQGLGLGDQLRLLSRGRRLSLGSRSLVRLALLGGCLSGFDGGAVTLGQLAALEQFPQWR